MRAAEHQRLTELGEGIVRQDDTRLHPDTPARHRRNLPRCPNQRLRYALAPIHKQAPLAP